MTDDKVADAIAAAESTQRSAKMTVRLAPHGRVVEYKFPLDMTDTEVIEFTGWLHTQFMEALRNERAKTANGRILLLNGVPH